MSKDVTAGAGARMIRVSDETLDSIHRPAPQGAQPRIRLAPSGGHGPVSSRPSPARCWPWKRRCTRRDGTGDEDGLHRRARRRADARRGACRGRRPLLGLCQRRRRRRPRPCRGVRARDYFAALEPSGACADAVACLKAAWLLLAPAVLNCDAAGRSRARRPSEAPAEALRACAAEQRAARAHDAGAMAGMCRLRYGATAARVAGCVGESRRRPDTGRRA